MTTKCERGEERWLLKVLVLQLVLYSDFSRLPYKLGAIIGPTNLSIRSKVEGWIWTGRLNKCNNGFYCRSGSNLPTHPWQGAPFSVERPVSEHKLDLADYEPRAALTETWLLLLLLSFHSAVFPALLDGQIKAKEADRNREVMEKGRFSFFFFPFLRP